MRGVFHALSFVIAAPLVILAALVLFRGVAAGGDHATRSLEEMLLLLGFAVGALGLNDLSRGSTPRWRVQTWRNLSLAVGLIVSISTAPFLWSEDRGIALGFLSCGLGVLALAKGLDEALNEM